MTVHHPRGKVPVITRPGRMQAFEELVRQIMETPQIIEASGKKANKASVNMNSSSVMDNVGSCGC